LTIKTDLLTKVERSRDLLIMKLSNLEN